MRILEIIGALEIQLIHIRKVFIVNIKNEIVKIIFKGLPIGNLYRGVIFRNLDFRKEFTTAHDNVCRVNS